jgi:hypothetical protein
MKNPISPTPQSPPTAGRGSISFGDVSQNSLSPTRERVGVRGIMVVTRLFAAHEPQLEKRKSL